jgi:hypothetical protein
MGWTFRKSFKIAPGVRLNLSKSGIGVSAGVKGFRVGTGPRGGYVSAGRGPFRYRKNLGSGHPARDAVSDSGYYAPVPPRRGFLGFLWLLFRNLVLIPGLILLLVVIACVIWTSLKH